VLRRGGRGRPSERLRWVVRRLSLEVRAVRWPGCGSGGVPWLACSPRECSRWSVPRTLPSSPGILPSSPGILPSLHPLRPHRLPSLPQLLRFRILWKLPACIRQMSPQLFPSWIPRLLPSKLLQSRSTRENHPHLRPTLSPPLRRSLHLLPVPLATRSKQPPRARRPPPPSPRPSVPWPLRVPVGPR
jgi:hypothetical protein